MSVACASRFAVLKLEDDDLDSLMQQSPSKTNANNTQTGKNKLNAKQSNNEAKSKSKKKKKNNEIAELQNLAFSNHSSKSKNKSSSNNSRQINASQKQWEEWQQKDKEFVSEAYEQDLQEALLLSKIDYEEKKEVYDALQKENEQNKNSQKKKKKNNQKKDKGVMSLDEFQNLPSSTESATCSKGTADLDDFELPPKSIPIDESNFFNKIEEDAEKIIHKEQRQEHYRTIERPLESARTLQFQEELHQKDLEIASLNESLTKVKAELKSVKERNKKLYGILTSGEMREKAEILIEMEKLNSVKDELTEQVSAYHTALEQERSKVHSLQMELKKFQQGKKNRTESK